MAKYNYLLTYTVEAQSTYDSDKEKAVKVRDKIAEIDDEGWQKLKDVETTFRGAFDIWGATTETEKRKESIKLVEDKFRPILKQYLASKHDVKIHCEMMLHEVKESYSFTVVNE